MSAELSEYRLYFNQGASTVITVEAEDLDEAIEAAYRQLPGGLCHHCARDVELSGDWELDEKSAAEDYPE